MSWYYDYYIGYKTPDNKIYPLGAYDDKGEIHSVLCRSRSFASDLWQDFYNIKDEDISDELRKAFSSSDGEFYGDYLSYIDVDSLPSGNFVKDGYFLLEDINDYLKDESYCGDLFYDKLSSKEFAFKLENELRFGYTEEKDLEGYPISHPCKDYAWFAYPDYSSKEYEAFILREFLSAYEWCESLKGNEPVIILSQG